MDRLTITLEPRAEPGHWTAVRLQVNGDDLNDLITAVERERGYEPLVPYDWLSLNGIRSARERLTGEASDDWPGDGRTVLLVCGECGEEGCWPITARIRVGAVSVTWRDFANDQFPDRDFSSLRFTFDRDQYEAEVQLAFDERGA